MSYSWSACPQFFPALAPVLLRVVSGCSGLGYGKQAENARVRLCLAWRFAGRNEAVPLAQCSETKELRSAGKYGLQLALATGKCVMKKHHTDDRSHSLQPGEGQLVFHQDLWSGVWAGFSVKSRVTGEPGPLAMEQGRQERDSSVLLRKGAYTIQKHSEKR